MAVMIALKTGTDPRYWLETPYMLETAINVLEEWSHNG